MVNNQRERLICCKCVGEAYLSAEIEKMGEVAQCDFCNQFRPTYDLNILVDRIEDVMLNHYERTPSEPTNIESIMMSVEDSGYTWEREGYTLKEILCDHFEIKKHASLEIQRILSDKYYEQDDAECGLESEFDSDAMYVIKGVSDDRWQSEWNKFGSTLKSESRFFNQRAVDILNSIFFDLDQLTTVRKESPLVIIGPGTKIEGLYRARVFQSDLKLADALQAPDLMIGPPPAVFAMNGRMNATGISVFYGATDALVALSEVRPPVGSKAVVARFEIIRPLQVLDLRLLSLIFQNVSVFDHTYLEKMEKVTFLRNLGKLMTTPVMPGDEIFEYMSTQAVADFLASQTKFICDGIIYPSVQTEGNKINVVLFYKSSRVDPLKFAPGTTFHVTDSEYDDFGKHTTFKVVEFIGEDEPPTDILDEKVSDKRLPTLKVDRDNIEVHIVKATKFFTEKHYVQWHREEKFGEFGEFYDD